ncbi:ABC transporter substrate-binding protein [Rhodococcus sp. ABRD24]|uniref:heme/hemin ABC transporter substrate-binding protein n=1 Tax=Rhodococcus sp. ABRD24 TaxID=2507582 RepID=UPI00103DA32F|nr:ABC transporter substrate-binding protein [Rhodococcus sp. ABRD24]QBJ98437.1 ABC transporter substrate-binding protein [Rhodococcus sp. ABRD24]
MRNALSRVLIATASTAAIVSVSACASITPTDTQQRGPTTAVVANADPRPVADNPAPQLPTTVRSFDGVDVTVNDVSRIVTADRYGTLTETVFALGLGANIVGRDTSSAFPAAKAIPNVTPGGQSMSAEAILNLAPTVVLTDTSIGPKSVQDQLRAAGIPVVYFDPTRTLEGVPGQITAVAQALGVPAQGAELVARTEKEIADARAMIPADADKPKIAFLYMRGPAITMMSGPGSGADSLIEALGGTDAGIASGLTQPFVPITSEAMIAASPDVMLMMSGGLASIGGLDGLAKVPGIAQTPAGINQRVVDMSDTMLLSFGTNTGQVLQALAGAIYHPDAE